MVSEEEENMAGCISTCCCCSEEEEEEEEGDEEEVEEEDGEETVGVELVLELNVNGRCGLVVASGLGTSILICFSTSAKETALRGGTLVEAVVVAVEEAGSGEVEEREEEVA